MLTILAFVVVLGITITIHEFGHFAAAKLLKIKVLTFSIGFGPKLVGFTRGGTEYKISPFPIGGYVKMAGETFDEDRQGAPDEFLSHPKWHRFLVAVAGPAMNIVLAVAILTFTFLEGAYVPKYKRGPAVVGPVMANSIAQRGGLRPGDRIASVRGVTVDSWEEMEIAIGTAPRKPLDLDIERAGTALKVRLEHPGTSMADPAALGFKFTLPQTKVQEVIASSPAGKAGLRPGDEIVAARGPAGAGRNYDEILSLISGSKGIPVSFDILRTEDGRSRLLSMQITPEEDGGRVLIGFSPVVPVDIVKLGIGGAILQSIRQNYEMAEMTFRIIGRIMTGAASVRSISGPIEIARLSGEVAESGSIRYFLGFIGLISLNLGVFNLLPIPILDGGIIALLLVEAILRRDLSLAVKERVVQAGFVFLIVLMGFVVVNDITKLNFDRFFR
jgi:regulator of sigma E protease